jgi:hypothetical protein
MPRNRPRAWSSWTDFASSAATWRSTRSGSDSAVSCSLATFGPAMPSTIGKPYIDARCPPRPCSQMKTGQRSGA